MPYEQSLLEYLLPIVGTDGNYGQAIGSGFLLQLSSGTVLITAAHVLSELQNCFLRVPSRSGMVVLEGKPHVTREIRDASFDADVGICLLDIEKMTDRPSATPLTVADLDVDDIPSPQTAYGCWGAPREENRVIGGEFDVRATFYGGLSASDETYDLVGRQPATHFVMNCDRRLMFGESCQPVQAPGFDGISGGPLFRLGTFEEIIRGCARPKLIGMMIEGWDRWSAVVSIRVSVIVTALRQWFPQFASELPLPSYVEVQMVPIPEDDHDKFRT